MAINLEVVRDSLRVFEHSVYPAIQLTIKYKLDQEMIPLSIKGSVYTEDNKFISSLAELPPVDVRNNKPPQGQEWGHVSTITYLTKEPGAPVNYTHELMFNLDKQALDYIEERRHQTRNHDVILTLYLTLTILKPSIRLGEFRGHNISGDIQAVITSPSKPAESDSNFSILVLYDKDGAKDRLFLEQLNNIKTTYTIPSSTWINDFQEQLGLGKFLIIEIPQFALDLNILNNASLSPDQQEFRNRLIRASEILMNIEKYIREGEWGDAVKGCRDAIEPFTKNLTSFIKEMVVKTTGVEEKNANQLTMAFDNLFNYSSGLHHQITRSGTVATRYIGGKEDAYMNYRLQALSLINLRQSLSKLLILIIKLTFYNLMEEKTFNQFLSH